MTNPIHSVPEGARRVKLPVNPVLADLFRAYAGNHFSDYTLLHLRAIELLDALEKLQAHDICSAERLCEDFMERL